MFQVLYISGHAVTQIQWSEDWILVFRTGSSLLFGLDPQVPVPVQNEDPVLRGYSLFCRTGSKTGS